MGYQKTIVKAAGNGRRSTNNEAVRNTELLGDSNWISLFGYQYRPSYALVHTLWYATSTHGKHFCTGYPPADHMYQV